MAGSSNRRRLGVGGAMQGRVASVQTDLLSPTALRIGLMAGWIAFASSQAIALGEMKPTLPSPCCSASNGLQVDWKRP